MVISCVHAGFLKAALWDMPSTRVFPTHSPLQPLPQEPLRNDLKKDIRLRACGILRTRGRTGIRHWCIGAYWACGRAPADSLAQCAGSARPLA